MFKPTPFKLLTVGLSASFAVISAPSGSTIMLVTLVCNISSAAEVPILRRVDTKPACGVRTCNSYNSIRRAPNTSYYYYSNSWRASVMTSLTISPISCKFPSVRVIRSKYVFDAFVFFHGTVCSRCYGCLSWVDVICGSMPPCSVSVSCSGEGDFFPSCSYPVLCCSANFAVSHVAWALAVASSFLRFSTSCAIRSFVSSFFCCAHHGWTFRGYNTLSNN